LIRADADPVQIARDYVAGGAVAISVLTEENYFQGSLNDLQTVRRAVDVPLLRKDFVFDEYQLYEAAIAGADAVLLIVAALQDAQLASLRSVIEEDLSMDALVEVHTQKEIQRAVACGATLIGVNNRDLRTFEVSLETSIRLIDEAPAGSLLISESGLKTRKDLERLQRVGYRGFLIGETLMRADSPKAALVELLERES
jgi:indole-3-glycerol phosphate synthase